MKTASLAILAALLAAAAGVWAFAGKESERPRLGLMTSLPIYWGENLDISEALDSQAPPHWARTALEEDYRLAPLDTLDALGDDDAPELLLLAQPRPLSPSENVALDDWVRSGGHVLIFADPLLTAHSRFHLGDRRRPQDVILLSPILRRWGLELTFDPAQPQGERRISAGEAIVAVSQAGRFERSPTSAPSDCTLEGDNLVADCRIERGRALIVADAALLDRRPDLAESRSALDVLTRRAFDR